MRSVLLESTDLEVSAGKFKLRDITFSLEEGQYLIVLGPTGCGKTMLLETLAGLRSPSEGKILLRGKDITGIPPEERHFGFAYQDSLLFPFLSVKENILFGAKARKRDNEPDILKRVDRLAEVMGISHILNRLPKFLSGGEKQRVSLARAILTGPPILLLDEPLSSLDPRRQSSMKELLQEIHRKEEMGIIHVTHNFHEALQLGSHLIIMNHGEIIQQGKTDDVFFHPATLDAANFLIGENLLKGFLEGRDSGVWFRHSENDLLLGPLNKKKLPSKPTKAVTLLIRAGDLMLCRCDASDPPDQNSWLGCIDKINLYSTHIEIDCTGKGCYKVALSCAEWKDLHLEIGSPVRISVDVDDIHVIPE